MCGGGEADAVEVVGCVNYVTEKSISKLRNQIMSNSQTLERKQIIWVEAPLRHDKIQYNNHISERNKMIARQCKENECGFVNINSLM